MAYEVKEEDRKQIQRYLEDLGVDSMASPQEVGNLLKQAIGDRGLTLYLIWKALEKRYPEIDAVGLLRDVCWERGQLPVHQWGDVKTPAEWVMKAFSKSTVLSCDQVFTEMNDKKAVVVFRCCPHMDAVRAFGATPEEVRRLCWDMMIAADFSRIEPYPHLKISFPGGTCGDGGQCVLTVELAEDGDKG